MKQIHSLWLVLLLCVHVHADSLSDSWSSFTSTMSSVGDGFKQFGEGFAESFGMAPPGYHYSFRVFNNSTNTVTAKVGKLKKIQGAIISDGTGDSVSLSQGTDSGETFKEIKLFLDVEVAYGGDTHTVEEIINPVSAYKDPSDGLPTVWNYYNVFDQTKDDGKGGRILVGQQTEYMGVTGPQNKGTAANGSYVGLTSDFSATICNAVDSPNTVTFSYAGTKYTVDIDASSYNFLDGDSKIPNCVRPKTGTTASILFKTGGALPINSTGFASAMWDKNVNAVSTSCDTCGPKACHYELIKDGSSIKAVQTGFTPGYYAQPFNANIRDISPVHCFVWNQSAAQMGITKGSPLVPFDQKNRSVWFVYAGQGWSTDKIPNGVVMGQVPLGEAVSFYIIRPSVFFKPIQALTADETKTGIKTAARFYVISLDTTNAANAQKFLTNLAAGKISFPQYVPPKSVSLTDAEKAALLTQPLPTNIAQLTDKDSGVSGILLTSDLFSPYGGGKGPFYYTVTSPQAYVQTVVGAIQVSCNPDLYTTDQQQSDFVDLVSSWFSLSQTDMAKAQQTIKAYLQTNGKDFIFAPGSTPGSLDKTTFTPNGNLVYQKIINGPGGLRRPPLLWMGGTNNHVYTQTDIPITWKPSKTSAL